MEAGQISSEMKNIILTTSFIFVLTCSFGQKKLGIKVYQNTDIFETQYEEVRSREISEFYTVNFNRISVAINIGTAKGYIHEIELLIPEISKSVENIQFPLRYEFRKDPTFESKASSYSFRYELSRTFTKKAKGFAFDFGIGLNPYYVHIEYVPKVETTYYYSIKMYGLIMNLTPRIKYKLSDRLLIDLNVPLNIYDMRGETGHIKNPAIPIAQQTRSDYEFIVLQRAYTIRLGLMYKLSK